MASTALVNTFRNESGELLILQVQEHAANFGVLSTKNIMHISFCKKIAKFRSKIAEVLQQLPLRAVLP